MEVVLKFFAGLNFMIFQVFQFQIGFSDAGIEQIQALELIIKDADLFRRVKIRRSLTTLTDFFD